MDLVFEPVSGSKQPPLYFVENAAKFPLHGHQGPGLPAVYGMRDTPIMLDAAQFSTSARRCHNFWLNCAVSWQLGTSLAIVQRPLGL